MTHRPPSRTQTHRPVPAPSPLPPEALGRLSPLPASFYQPSAAQVAPQLLGHLLIRNTPAGPCGGVIVETEAYLADDPACHGFRRQTPRNRSMYGPAGHAYVYFIYGNHYCMNVVCRPAGHPEAVLIRALEPALGLPLLQAHRPVADSLELTNGPGKLCAALAISRTLDGLPLWDPSAELCVARNPQARAFRSRRGPVVTTARIGIRIAAELPLRFYLEASPWVSRRVSVRKRITV